MSATLQAQADIEKVELPTLLADMVAHDPQHISRVDSEVVIPLMRVHAAKVLPIFRQRLEAIIPGAKLLEGPLAQYAKHEKLIAVAPVKGQQRMQVRAARLMKADWSECPRAPQEHCVS